MSINKSDKLLTLIEAESLTGRKVATWRRAILERKVAFVKIGRSVRIPREVIDKLINEGWREPVQSPPDRGG